MNWSTATINQCTIAGNSGPQQGGGIDNEGTMTLDNSIVAGNTTNIYGADLYTSPSHSTVLNYSLLQNPYTWGGCSSIRLRLQRGPQARGAGLRRRTDANHPAPLDSPAIGHGSNAYATGLTTDQRGYPRIVGTNVDMGAYESQPFSIVVDNPVDENDGNYLPGDISASARQSRWPTTSPKPRSPSPPAC